MSAAMLLLVAMKPIAGRVYDRGGARTGTQLLAGGILLAALCALQLPDSNALRLYPILLAVCGTAQALPCAALARAPDGQLDTRAYARLTAASSLGAACGTPMAGFAFDAAGSYRPMWRLCMATAASAWLFFRAAAQGEAGDRGQNAQNHTI